MVVAVMVATVAATAVEESSAGRQRVKPGNKTAAEKRRKELDRQKWQKEKADRRQQRLNDRQAHASENPDEDPDLAGIVPGPQPLPEQLAEGAPVAPAVTSDSVEGQPKPSPST
jgi:hypothetical protein